MQNFDVESLFAGLLHHRDRSGDFSGLGLWLQHRMRTCRFPDLEHLPFQRGSYTRNCMAKEHRDSFELWLMRWDKQAKTPIHGHPAFSFYHVISGAFEMEIFTRVGGDRLQLKETRFFRPSETTWFLGPVGRYDNFIHRVICLEPGHTLHVYSEDSHKGISFS